MDILGETDLLGTRPVETLVDTYVNFCFDQGELFSNFDDD